VQIGSQVADSAREAFVHAMSRGSIVVALIAGVGALIAWRYLPARASEQLAEENDDAEAVQVGRTLRVPAQDAGPGVAGAPVGSSS